LCDNPVKLRNEINPLESEQRGAVALREPTTSGRRRVALLKPKRYPLHYIQIRRILENPRQKKTGETNSVVKLGDSLRLGSTDLSGRETPHAKPDHG